MLAACGGPGEGSFTNEDGETVDYDIDSSGEESTFTMRGDDGEEIEINTGTSVEADLPGGFTLYPGATVVSTSNVSVNEGKGTIVFMTSSDSPAELADFYKAQAEAAGIAINMENTSATSKMIAGQNEAGDSFTISANATDGGSSAQLMVGVDLQ